MSLYFLLVHNVLLVETVLAFPKLGCPSQLSLCEVSPCLEEDKENISLKEVKRTIPLVMEARNRLVDK